MSAAVLLVANQPPTKSKDDDLDAAMVGVVEKAIEVSDPVAASIAASRHTEKATLRNVQAIWAKTLLHGLWQQVCSLL